MFKNFLKVAFRNLWRHRIFSFINLIGLAMGLSACFFIYLYVSYELNYDSYHTKADRIFRLTVYDDRPSESHYGNPSSAIGPALKNEYPDIQAMARINFSSFLVMAGEAKFQENNVMIADSSLFSIFSFPLIKGDAGRALKDPFSVVFSQTAARKYFGNTDPIGQTISLDWNQYGKYNAKITGVMRDFPGNSQFKSDIILSMTSITQKVEPQLETCWDCPRGPTYLLLPEGSDAEHFQLRLNSFLKKNEGKFISEERGHLSLSLEPLKKIYLHGKYPSMESGNISYIYIFSTIAIFILLIACINFVNLTTARSIERAKEVGIRKVIGSSKIQLISQFLGESLIICLMAFLVACVMCILLLPLFNELCGKVVSHGLFEQFGILLRMLVTSLTIGLIAGIYPALILSSYRPVSVLKSSFTAGNKGMVLRKILVICQFSVSIGLIISTIVVYRQLEHMRSLPLGFNKDQMLVIDFHKDPEVKKQIEIIKQELTKIPNVLSASASSDIPNSEFVPANYSIENGSGAMQLASISLYMVDEDFFHQYRIPVLAGRAFSKQFTTDFKDALVVNEATLTKFGYTLPEQIIGKRFSGEGSGTVIGVVKDFNFRSLHDKIEPLIFRTFFLGNRYITLNINAKNVLSTIRALEAKWKQLEPQRPFEYFFLDETINKQYGPEENFGRLFLYFGILAVIISNLGLFGLALFNTWQRTREIGVRKVIGAGVISIVNLLAWDFLRLVVIAFIFASPIAWLGMNKWLDSFAYRVGVSWWIFLIAGSLSLFVAFFTVSFQTIKAARRNPMRSLRPE